MKIYRNHFADRDKYIEKREARQQDLINESKKLVKNDNRAIYNEKENSNEKDEYKKNISLKHNPCLNKNDVVNIKAGLSMDSIEKYYKKELGSAAYDELKNRFYNQLSSINMNQIDMDE